MTFDKTSSTLRAALGATALTLIASVASADQVILDDLIVDGSLCVGQDCVNGESFGFDTIRMKENNLRIKAQDTSSTGSFPSNDWQITFNDSSNGGVNKFSIDDIDGGRTPFTIIAGAPSNSLFVSAQGRLGLGTSTPVVEAHVVDGDSPTIRLEQNGSSGFTAQTWDLAGNEANFFLRDVTNGSKLPFKVRPGAASDALSIGTNGNVGIGAGVGNAPAASLHVRRTDGTAMIHVEEASTTTADRTMLELENDGGSRILYTNNNGTSWVAAINAIGSEYRILPVGGASDVFLLSAATGNLTIGGNLTENSDKNAKMAIQPIDPAEILQKVVALPVSTWTYKDEAASGVRHIGPMAQDFYALFGTGHTDKGISTLDTSGVALAAIKALSDENAELRALLAAQDDRLNKLETHIAD